MPVPSLVSYGRIEIVQPDPTGAAGLSLNNSLKALNDALDGKADTSALALYLTLADASELYTPYGHTHAISDVTGLQTALDGKADLSGASFSGDVSALNFYADAVQVSTVKVIDGSTDIVQLLTINGGVWDFGTHSLGGVININASGVVNAGTLTGNGASITGLTKSQVGLGNVVNSLQLVASNNLSDLTNVTTARTNLGLGTSSTSVYNVRHYGAVGDGTTDDTTAINSAITAMTAGGGGVLFFPYGKYVTSGGHTISVPCQVVGQGQGYYHDDLHVGGSTGYDYFGVASSLIKCTSATAYCFTFTTPYAQVKDLQVHVTATTPTAGGAFKCQGDGNNTISMFSRYLFERVTILDGYYGIEHAVGSLSVWDNVTCVGQRKYCFWLRDDANADCGDWCVNNCYFVEHGSHTTDAAIRYESGGGLKVTNTKFVGTNVTHGLWLHFDTGANSGQLLINNCSMDTISGNGIRLETAGTGSFSSVIVGNCYISTVGTDYEPIYINNGGAGLGSVFVDHCHIVNVAASSKACITAVGSTDVLIGTVNFGGSGTGLYSTSGGASVVGGWYADPGDGSFAVRSLVFSKGAGAGLAFGGRNGDDGYLWYSDSQAGGVQLYNINAGTRPFTIAADGALGFTKIKSNGSILNNYTGAQLYISNALASGAGHASVSIDKGADTAASTLCFLSAGVSLWDIGPIGDNNFEIRDATDSFAKVVKVEQGAGANALTIKSGGRTLLGTATDDGSSRLQVSGTVSATTFSGSGASLTSLNASNLSSGTVGTARLGTGTADSTTYLRGDGTWATPTGTGSGATDLDGLSDVTITSVTTGNLLRYNGTAWVNTTLVAADIPDIAESQVTNLTTDLAAKAPLASPTFTGTVTLPDVTMGDGKNFALNTTTGTKIGTATTQKLGFFNSTPVAQQTGNLITALSNLGLVTSGAIAESDATNLVSDLAAKAPLASPTFTGTLTTAAVSIGDGSNIALGTTTGTKIGTGTTQKLGFFNATPVVRQTGSIVTGLSNLGLITSGTIAESDVTNLTTDLAAKAPLASPTFTGTVSAAAITTTGKVTVGNALAGGVGSVSFGTGTISINSDSYNTVNVGTLTGNLTINNPTGTPRGEGVRPVEREEGTGRHRPRSDGGKS